MEFPIVDYFVNFASLLFVLDNLELLKGGAALLNTLVRGEEGKNLAIETESALLLCCFSIKL